LIGSVFKYFNLSHLLVNLAHYHDQEMMMMRATLSNPNQTMYSSCTRLFVVRQWSSMTRYKQATSVFTWLNGPLIMVHEDESVGNAFECKS
jgi:hypothetical protein